MTAVAPMWSLFTAPKVLGLDDATQDLLNGLVKEWAAKRDRNLLRASYVDGKNVLKNLGIAIPPSMSDIEIVVGWPEKAVYGLAQRCMWDGIISPSGSEDPFELRQILDDNRFDIEIGQGIVSELTHSLTLVSTTPGDTSAGEPEVVVMFHSAAWSSALWDRRRRAISAAMIVNEADELSRPTLLTIFTPTESIVCRQATGGGAWYVDDVIRHRLGRTPVEPLAYRPTLDRPFGRSRVNRTVMSITDRAVRVGARMEVSAELFSAPKFLLLGADGNALLRDQNGQPVPLWTWYLGRFNTLSRDENGDIPSLEQIKAESPEPHVAQMRQLAAEFMGATGIPISSLGIVQDNPASAEAIYAAKEDLVIEATNLNRVNGASLSRVYQNIVMIRDGLTEPTDELLRLDTHWLNPALPSVVSASDAMVKQIAVIPELAESDVALEQLGYTGADIMRIRADIRRARGRRTLDEVLAGQDAAPASRATVLAQTAPAAEVGAVGGNQG